MERRAVRPSEGVETINLIPRNNLWCFQIPVLCDFIFDMTRSEAVLLSSLISLFILIVRGVADIPTCISALALPNLLDVSRTVALSFSFCDIFFSLVAISPHHSPLWLIASFPLAFTSILLMYSYDSGGIFLGIQDVLQQGYAHTVLVSTLLSGTVTGGVDHSVPISVVVFLSSLFVVMSLIRAIGLWILFIRHVIFPFRAVVFNHDIKAWTNARRYALIARWRTLLPSELKMGTEINHPSKEDPRSLWVSKEDDDLADVEEQEIARNAFADMESVGPRVGGFAVGGFANEDVTHPDFISRSKSGARAAKLRENARAARRNVCASIASTVASVSASVPLRLKLAVLVALAVLVVSFLWFLALSVFLDLSPRRLAIVHASSAAGVIVISISVIGALARAVADHRLIVTLRARRNIDASRVAELLGGSLGRALMAADVKSKDDGDNSVNGHPVSGAIARALAATVSSQSDSERSPTILASARAFESPALRLAVFRLGLDLINAPAGTAPFHRVPFIPAFSHVLAWDFVPAFVMSVFVAAAALASALAATGILLEVVIVQVPKLTAVVFFAALATVVLRAMVYPIIELACVRRKPGGVSHLRFSRGFMIVDALSLISPISWAVGAIFAVCRAAASILSAILSIAALDRPVVHALAYWDAPHASYSAMLRLALYEGLPPGFQEEQYVWRSDEDDDDESQPRWKEGNADDSDTLRASLLSSVDGDTPDEFRGKVVSKTQGAFGGSRSGGSESAIGGYNPSAVEARATAEAWSSASLIGAATGSVSGAAALIGAVAADAASTLMSTAPTDAASSLMSTAPKPLVFRQQLYVEGNPRESSKTDMSPSPPAAAVTTIDSAQDVETAAIEAPVVASADQTAVVVAGDAPPDDASDPLVSLADASTVQLSSERAAELEMELLS